MRWMNPFNKVIERSFLPRWDRSPDLSRIQQSSPGDETVSLLNSIPPNIRWAFEKNPEICRFVLARYPRGHPYWKYLDGLVASLISEKCDGIQDKMKDVGRNNMLKFESAISELRVALLLARSGKSVRLLSDDYLPGKSPDIHATDGLGNYYVEVVRFSDDETIETIFEQVGAILSSLP